MPQHSRRFAFALVALLVAACGRNETVASKSADAFRDAQAKGTPVSGGHDHGQPAAPPAVDHSAHGTAADPHAGHAPATPVDHSGHAATGHAAAASDAHAGHTAGAGSSHAQHGATNTPRGTSHAQHAAPHAQHATPNAQHAAPNAQHGTSHAQHGTNTQHGSSHTQHGAPNAQHGTPHAQHGTAAQRTPPRGGQAILPVPPSNAHAQHGTTHTQHGTHAQHGTSHTQHGSTPAPAPILDAPRTNAEIARTQPAATLRPDAFDAPVPVSVEEARRAENAGGHGNHGGSAATQHEAHGQQNAALYVCPMHPEVTSATPASCPKCGMALVKKE